MKKRVLKIIIIIFIILIALCSIGAGIYLNKISKPKAIFDSVIDGLSNRYKTYFMDLDSHNVGDNFTINSEIKTSLSTEANINNPDEVKYFNLAKNLNNRNTKLIVKQDKNHKKAYIEVDDEIPLVDTLQVKYLIDNSTEYYFVNKVLSYYVNIGGCNYFETLNEENTTVNNINYLYDIIIKSFKDSLKEDYFSTYEVDGLNMISIRLSDNRIRTILRDTLENLKNDEKANHILTSINEDFTKIEISDKTIFLNKKEGYNINIYTTKVLNKPVKYEINHLDTNYKRSYIYNVNDNVINVVENDKFLYKIIPNFTDEGFDFDIKNTGDTSIGNLKYEKTSDKVNFTFSFADNDIKYGIMYNSKYLDVKNSSYTNNKSLVIQVVKDKKSMLNGNIEMVNLVTKDVKIEEETANAILDSSLSVDNKNLINTRINNFKNILG